MGIEVKINEGYTQNICKQSSIEKSVPVEEREEREKQGQCPSCGQQLYHLKPVDDACCLSRCFGTVVIDESKGTKRMVQKKPLSIPGLVDRGQCVNCLNRSNSSSNTKTSSLAEDDPFSMFPHPLSPLPSAKMDRDIKAKAKANASMEGTATSANSLLGNLKPPPLTATPGAVSVKPASAVTSLTRTTTTSPSATLSSRPAPTPGSAVYVGEYNAKGEKQGQGEMIWSNGDVYHGWFVNDKRHGHGTLTFAPAPGQTDAGEYVGDWMDGQMHGSGTRRYPNGDVYMGSFQHGKRTGGEGRFYYANGDLFWGQWHDNHMHGPGRYYYASGQRFEGTFFRSKRMGSGKLQRQDGTLEVFQYINDERVGKGVRWSGDRTKAWCMWMPSSSGTGQTRITAPLEKKSISVAEAVALVSEIELAAGIYAEEMASQTGIN